LRRPAAFAAASAAAAAGGSLGGALLAIAPLPPTLPAQPAGLALAPPRRSFSASTEAPPAAGSASTSSSSSSSSSAASSDSSSSSPPPPPGAAAGGSASAGSASAASPAYARWYGAVEDAKDVLYVAFGLERRRDLAREYDLGLRAYPWVVYEDPARAGALTYRNRETGLASEVKPADFDLRAGPGAFITLNAEATGLAVVAGAEGAGGAGGGDGGIGGAAGAAARAALRRAAAGLSAGPVGQGLRVAAEAVAASPVGAAVGQLKGARDRYVESWETSQHPLVVSSSYAVDAVLAETEHGRAVRSMRLIDAGFDEFAFVVEMRDAFLPALCRAFFRHDVPALTRLCRETALAQCRSHQAARESAGQWRHDGVVLAVSQVNLMKAQSLEQGVPVLLVSAMVQYINTVRNKKVRRARPDVCARGVSASASASA